MSNPDILARIQEEEEKRVARAIKDRNNILDGIPEDDEIQEPVIITKETIARIKEAVSSLISSDATEEDEAIANAIGLQEWNEQKTRKKAGTAWNPESLECSWISNQPEPFQFIIPGLLAKGVCGFLYGAGGTFKSMAAIWLAVQRAITTAKHPQLWLDSFLVNHGKTVYFSAEDVRPDLHHRLHRIIETIAEDEGRSILEIEHAIIANCWFVSREEWVKDKEGFLLETNGKECNTVGSKLRKVCKLVKECGADLVIIETVSRIAAIDENDNSAGARLVGLMEDIRDATGATILFIDHSSKAAISGDRSKDVTGQTGQRGASSKIDNARFGLWFQAMKRSDSGIDQIKVVNSKSFRCLRADSFVLDVNYPKFTRASQNDIKPDLSDEVLKDVTAFPGTTQRQSMKRIHARHDRVNAAFKQAESDGYLVQDEDTGGYYVR